MVCTSSEWRRQIQEVDSAIFGHLREAVTGGFDEERFALRIGFGNLKRFLEVRPTPLRLTEIATCLSSRKSKLCGQAYFCSPLCLGAQIWQGPGFKKICW